jgi:hypothetical protein
VAVFGLPYVAFYFMVAVLVAYVAPDPRTIAIQLGVILLALFGPVLYGPEDSRTSLAVALVVAPVLLLTAGLFAYLRQKMVHDRRAYHRFAEQTLVLSSRIAGRQVGPMGLLPQPESVPSLAWVSPPSRLVAAAAAVLGVPLLAGSLAVAGVKLPSVAADPFERVGIELPNQEASAPQPLRSVTAGPRAAGVKNDRPRDGSGGSEPSAAASAGKAVESSPEAGTSATSTVTDARQAVPAGPASSPPPAPEQPTAPGELADKETSQLGGLFDEASEGLQGLLEEIASESRK